MEHFLVCIAAYSAKLQSLCMEYIYWDVLSCHMPLATVIGHVLENGFLSCHLFCFLLQALRT